MNVKNALIGLMVAATVIGSAPGLAAQQGEPPEKEGDRLRDAATVLGEIFGMPDSIPQDLLDKAECVIVFPSVKKVALGSVTLLLAGLGSLCLVNHVLLLGR